MLVEEVKSRIQEIVGDQIDFEGHFNLVVNHMSHNQQLNFIEWVKKCDDRDIDPDPSPLSRNLLVFFFKPRVTNIRGILTKRKNSYFITLFLDKHKYYDKQRRKLGFR